MADPLAEKSYQLSLIVSKKVMMIRKTFKEYDLTNQLIRSVTSIAANIEESKAAQSRADFYNKVSIAHKEAYETRFWLRLLKDLKILEQDFYVTASNLLEETIKILGKTRSTLKKEHK